MEQTGPHIMHSFYAFRSKTVEYIIILASLILSHLTKLVLTYRLYAFSVTDS